MTPLQPVWSGAPRWVPDRPPPRYRFVPGALPHPRTDPAGSLRGEPEHAPGLGPEHWQEDETFLYGVDLYHQGYLWESHEAFEACYHATSGAHRALLQGLIQLAAALLQVHRGRAKGAGTLARRARARLREATAGVGPDGRLAGLDPLEVLADLERHLPGAFGATTERATAGDADEGGTASTGGTAVPAGTARTGDVLATNGAAPRLRLS